MGTIRPSPSTNLAPESMHLPQRGLSVLSFGAPVSIPSSAEVSDLPQKGEAYSEILSRSDFGVNFEEPHINNKPSQVPCVSTSHVAGNVVRFVVHINSSPKSGTRYRAFWIVTT